MSYEVLARKYRPQTFGDVVGQAHVTRTLANAIKSGRVGHAYLFSGPRGVGKTTTARLLAKSLNCPNVKDAVPCNECDVCQEIRTGVSLDVIEIDAASNRGIDEIRNLRENVKYAPAGGKYKVYVVDEVHMLTDAAFNALLKTLEEPPPHVKFVLATTAPLKVPETILSRCQRFEFVRIATNDICERLKLIRKEEGFDVSDEVLMLLSRRANGSLRDAESMLDQLVSAGLETASESEVAKLMGLSGADVFFSIVEAVKEGDARAALEALGKTFGEGANLEEFTDGLMEHLRSLLLIKIHPDLSSLVEASKGHIRRFEEQAKKFTEADLLRLVGIASRASYSTKRSSLPRLHLEMAVVEMAYLDSTVELGELIARLAELESRLAGEGDSSAPEGKLQAPGGRRHATAKAGPPEPLAAKPSPEKSAAAPKKQPLSRKGEREKAPVESSSEEVSPVKGQKAVPKTEGPQLAQVKEKWPEILARITERKKMLGVCLTGCRIRELSGGKLVLAFPEHKHFDHSMADSRQNKKVLQEELAAVLGVSLAVSCVISHEAEDEGPLEVSETEEQEPGGGPKPEDSLKTVIEFFDGEIIED